jgi:glycolate oxidase FAD binding subunit
MDRFEIDGRAPICVAAPLTEDGVAAVLTEARKARVAVVPIGGGCHQAIGNVPRGYDVALDTSGLRATLEHEPDDVTVTVDAGVRIDDLAAALATHGQWLPIDAPADATVGGVVAANVSGPLRHAFGTLRDWVIGMRVAQPDGSVSKSGGRVVKNVAGYDMHKLHIGALGTLGVITQVTFKLATIPQRNVWVSARFTEPATAVAFVLDVRDRRLSCIAAEVGGDATLTGERWRATLRLAGSQAAVERSLRDLVVLAAARGTAVIEGGDEAGASARASATSLVVRASVLPSQVGDLLNRFSTLNGGAVECSSTVCAGLVRTTAHEPIDARAIIDDAWRHVVDLGGSLFVEGAPLELKQEIDVFGAPRPDWEIMRRLKHEFDPADTLSPGRLAGRL